MSISADIVKQLRERSGAGMMDCKKALVEAGGDMDKAMTILREKGISKAATKAGRATKEGVIGCYVHPGDKLAVLVEINCETDFVARTDQYKELARNLAMHVAAANPLVVRREELSQEQIAAERDIYRTQALNEGKPEKIVDKIVDGKVDKYYAEVCLMEQAYVKDPDKTINDLINEMIGKIGENMSIRRFVRFRLGE
ncbi:MAG: translation elongation factor Ts [Candidatus Zixiibacteriota bacterium]|nr:MAG: translation elongation factor Ts [candidate division Zixibacteria bacterium]